MSIFQNLIFVASTTVLFHGFPKELFAEASSPLINSCDVIEPLASAIMDARQRGETFEKVMAPTDQIEDHQVAFIVRLLVYAAFSPNDSQSELKEGELEKTLSSAAFSARWEIECLGWEKWSAKQKLKK